MLRHAAVLVLLVGLVIAPTPSRGALPQEKLFEEGIENIAAGNYTAALDVLDRALAASPESPEGYFLKASLFHILKAHFARPDYRKQWRENATKAFSLAEKMLEKNENDARALVLTGLVHGMEIVDALHRSKYFSAFGLAGSMNTHLERALEIEPKRHDAYYGLGVYHIRGSTEGWVRLFRFFVGDTSAKGREYLRRAVAGKGWTTNSAQLALVWDLLRVEKFEEARKEIASLRARYPNNGLYDVAYAESFFVAGDCRRARAEYAALKPGLGRQKEEVAGLYEEFAVWRILRCDHTLGERSERREELQELLEETGRSASLIEQIRTEVAAVNEALGKK